MILVWFRQDLRINDNPALYNALNQDEVLPIFIYDNTNSQHIGEASKVWLHYSLQSLNKSLGNKLSCYCGDPITIIKYLIKTYDIQSVYWNRCYEPWQIKRDTEIKSMLSNHGVGVISYNGSLLWEPWSVLKSDQTPYKIFTHFYRKGCLSSIAPRAVLPLPTKLNLFYDIKSLSVEQLALLPNINWYQNLVSKWDISELGANNLLVEFVKTKINSYKLGRDYPNLNTTSRLSPYLHFGQISPHQIWYTIKQLYNDDNTEHFCSELVWREFSYNLLYYNPELATQNLQYKFNYFPWHNNHEQLLKWQTGQTGIPIIDAGMRELWQTGYMHNRVRMIVGSFLVKNLLIDWRYGAKWFFNTLFDADLANNSASWQWVAGSGTDAAPYFRIFNPVTQGQKFDSDGYYTRKYVKELNDIPNKYLFNPWEAPPDVLKHANIQLGVNYPFPIVDLKNSRQLALSLFNNLQKV